MNDDSDLRRYEEFQKHWNEGSSIEEDSVVLTVRHKALKAAALGWADWIKDLEHETLLKLAKGEYRGEGPLDGYIAHIMGNEIRLLWRKEGRNRRTEMPDELEDNRSFATEIEDRLSDRAKRLMVRSPKHLWWYIEAIVGAEGYLSERDAAAIGNVTRHRVVKLREELRRIWESMEAESEPSKMAKTTVGGKF